MSQEKVDFFAKECERYCIPMSVLEHTCGAQLEQEIVDLFYATIAEKRGVEDESSIVDNFVL